MGKRKQRNQETKREQKREELLSDLVELEAYAELEGEAFDFGGGLVENTGEYRCGVEYVYIKMDIEAIGYRLHKLEEKTGTPPTRCQRGRQYRREWRKNEQEWLRELGRYGAFWLVNERIEGYYSRCYIGNKHLKRRSNRAVRRNKALVGKGGDYKKVYDYWWELV